MDNLIERLRNESTWHVGSPAKDDTAGLLREAANALEAAREDVWQPIETSPNANIVVMFCDERQNIWTDYTWNMSDAVTGFYATHWRPLPAPPKEDRNG